jgi:hypothetical protein
MAAHPALLTREARARLLERLAELGDLDRLIRQPGGLPEVPEPVPLHRRRGTKFSTESTTKLSTTEKTTTS